MTTESGAHEDLALDPDDAENVTGGRTKKAPKTQLPITGPVSGSEPDDGSSPKRSLEGVESH